MPLSTRPPLLEICVDTPDGLATAIAAGVDRIELCSALDLGGLTPSPGLIALARTSPVPIYAMVRPRAGDFAYSPREVETMRGDIAAVRAAGLAGIVLGTTEASGELDRAMLGALLQDASGLGVTLHRAFDLTPDPVAALETAIGLGFERILTSGGAAAALQGVALLEQLVSASRGRIGIMAGGGVRPENVTDLVRRTGITEVHASARVTVPAERELVARGFSSPQVARTDRDTIRHLQRALAETV